MSRPDSQILNQLSNPQKIVAEVLTENWAEVRQACADPQGEFCGLTNQKCCFSKCPKMEESRNGENTNSR